MLEFSWSAFGFAVVNFLVLTALLWKFLHKPLLRTLDKRQERIAAARQQAASENEKAQSARAQYDQKLKDAAAERDVLLVEARRAGDEASQRLLDSAASDAKRSIEELKKADERERRDASDALQRSIVEAGIGVAATVLAKVSDEEIESKLTARLLKALDSLAASGEMAVAQDDCPVNVTSAAELSSTQRSEILQRLASLGVQESALTFGVDDALVAGVRIEFSDRAIDASLSDVLARVKQAVDLSAPASSEETVS